MQVLMPLRSHSQLQFDAWFKNEYNKRQVQLQFVLEISHFDAQCFRRKLSIVYYYNNIGKGVDLKILK